MASSLFLKKRQQHHFARFIKSRKSLAAARKYVQLVEEARREWVWAERMLAEAVAGERIDQLLLYQSVARQRYFYLLKKAAEDGLKADPDILTYLVFAARNGICRRC